MLSKKRKSPHPWFAGIPDKELRKFQKQRLRIDIPDDPIIFLSHGHSGTRLLTSILHASGIWMGNCNDGFNLNRTWDSLIWTYGFQRSILPNNFTFGQGCHELTDRMREVSQYCYSRHVENQDRSNWGFKTCDASFSIPIYANLFPNAKYIRLTRDGRDVVLSENGFFHMSNPHSNVEHWLYFLIITFGFSNDLESAPFVINMEAPDQELVKKYRFWLQAKSWKEDIIAYETNKHLLDPDRIVEIKYEELVQDTHNTLQAVYGKLGLDLDDKTLSFVNENIHYGGMNKWQEYDRYISDSNENMEAIFDFMKPELKKLNYSE